MYISKSCLITKKLDIEWPQYIYYVCTYNVSPSPNSPNPNHYLWLTGTSGSVSPGFSKSQLHFFFFFFFCVFRDCVVGGYA